MAATATAIRLDGLREFQAKLRVADSMFPRELRLVFNDAATLVVEGARPLIPRRSGDAAGSLRPFSSQRMGRVDGGKGVPYYGWLDFGGHVGRHASVFRPRVGRDGRYIYPAFKNRRGKVLERCEEGLTRVASRAGLI